LAAGLTDILNMVSIIILAYNRRDEALKTIAKLKQAESEFNFPTEIIVVDNASADGTSAAIKAQYPEVKLITRQHNNGIAGWNDGFAVARYPYFLVLDDDSHMHSGLNRAIEHLQARASIGILGLQIKDEQLRTDEFLVPADAWKDGEEIAGFIGCGAIIRKTVYEKIGGFAEWMFVYTHEFEYAIRCLNAGYQVRFFAKGIVIHRASVINRTNKRLRVFGTRNEMAIVYKYFSSGRLKYIWRILINNLKFIKREGWLSGWYVIKGYLEFLKLKKTLPVTPVSQAVQNYYSTRFWGTQPVWTNLKKRFTPSRLHR
jgi:GT2 family glycosyltransferase